MTIRIPGCVQCIVLSLLILGLCLPTQAQPTATQQRGSLGAAPRDLDAWWAELDAAARDGQPILQLIWVAFFRMDLSEPQAGR